MTPDEIARYRAFAEAMLNGDEIRLSQFTLANGTVKMAKEIDRLNGWIKWALESAATLHADDSEALDEIFDGLSQASERVPAPQQPTDNNEMKGQ